MHRECGAGAFARDDAGLRGLQAADLLERRRGKKLIRPFDPRRAIHLQLKIQRALIAIRPLILAARPGVTSRPWIAPLAPLEDRPVGKHASVAIGARRDTHFDNTLLPHHVFKKRYDAFSCSRYLK